MDLDDTPEEAAFRAEVRGWLATHSERRGVGVALESLDPETRLARARAFQQQKARRGFAAITWPKELGGLGGSEIQRLIYSQEEAERAVDSNTFFGIGIHLCVATVVHSGTDQQKRRYIERALQGEEIWCQLFSEPACGSDLAAVRTTATRNGAGWIINGQKVWSTGAHYCDFGLLLARTDSSVPKHRGLTMFILDMKAPGVQVRPIKQMTGESDFNEVFLVDVPVADEQRVGAPGTGWNVALTTLMHERMTAGAELGFLDWAALLELASRHQIDGRAAIEDARIKERLADTWLNNFGAKLLSYRAQTALSRGQIPGPEQSILKPLIAAQGQQSAYLAMDLLSECGLLTHEELGEHWREVEHAWTWGAAYRIAGGTDEILRNVVAERVLGLPADIRVDKDVPFSATPA